MNSLIRIAGIIAFALCGSHAQAGTPMMDEPLPLSVRGETSSRFKAEIGDQHAKPQSGSYRGRRQGKTDGIKARWGYNPNGF